MNTKHTVIEFHAIVIDTSTMFQVGNSLPKVNINKATARGRLYAGGKDVDLNVELSPSEYEALAALLRQIAERADEEMGTLFAPK